MTATGVAAPPPRSHDGLSDFLGARDRLLRIARRIVGADAEDVVQDAWLSWTNVDRTVVRNPTAFLSVTTTRLSITRARSAYARHHSFNGLPENEPTTSAADPAIMAESAERLRGAIGVLVARLSLRERVAYVLREAFELPYLDIGRLLGLTEANARQIVRRARLRVALDRPVPDGPLTEQMQLVAAFADAVAAGDPALLANLAREEGQP